MSPRQTRRAVGLGLPRADNWIRGGSWDVPPSPDTDTVVLQCTGYAVPHRSWWKQAQEQWDVGASAEPIEWM